MPDQSPKLLMPYIQPSQAQKHVTHNEALRVLDALVQATVIETGRNDPPETPQLGDSYVIGAGATGLWSGRGDALAIWQTGGWFILPPRAGWRVWDSAGGLMVIYDGSAWVPQTAALGPITDLGVNASPDATNRFALASDATLLSHDGAGHQVKVNKAAAPETASLVFQSDWTGHAEIGLAGGISFDLKISADGSTWNSVLRADPAAQSLHLAPAGTDRMVITDTGITLDAPVTGAAVQAAPHDATPGTLLTAGAFGLGGAAPRASDMGVSDFDALVTGGVYSLSGPLANGPGGAGASPYDGTVQVVQGAGPGGAAVTQIAAIGSMNPAQYIRVGSGAPLVWSAWTRSLTRADITGTVAQTAGVPTGAVVERGQNANGSYTRFADGTQICTTQVSGVNTDTAFGEVFRGTPTAAPYPMPFVGDVAGSGSSVDIGYLWVNGRALDETEWSFTTFAGRPRTNDVVALMAVGRWF